MTKISIYNIDEKVLGNDKWIGSDAQNHYATKNFTPTKLAAYFNENQVIDVGTPIRYRYDILEIGDSRLPGTITFNPQVGTPYSFSNISTFLLSKYTLKGNDVTEYLNFLIGTKILFSKSSDINIFGYFKVVDIEEYLPEPNFFQVTLEYLTGNGSIEEDRDYLISLIDISTGGGESPTLDQVTTAGNTTDNSIVLTNPYSPDYTLTNTLTSLNSYYTHASPTQTDYIADYAGYGMFLYNAFDSIVKDIQIHDSIVYLSWNDGVDYSSVTVQSAPLFSEVSATYGLNENEVISSAKLLASSDSASLLLYKSPTNGGSISVSNLNNIVNLEFPDKPAGTYTIATTADTPDLSGYVPYTGATQDVNLGEFGLLTGNVEFDNTPTNTPTGPGSLVWNDSDGTLDLKLKGSNVTLQIGQETVMRVVNKTVTNIDLLESNYQVVRLTGAQGQRPKVDLALAVNDANSAETLGLVTENIANNQEGFITTSGIVRNINTTGSLQGETWIDGDILYVSGTIAGQLTNIKPISPIHLVIVGYVIYAHINNGKIFVKVDNGYELQELHNVSTTAPNNNEVLTYNTTTSLWEPKTVFQLPALTNGSVLFSNGTTIAQDNANLFWNDGNNRLGILTTNPQVPLHVTGSIRAADTTGLLGITLVPANNTITIGSITAATTSGSGIFYGSSQNFLHLRTLSTTRLYINSTGDIGVNTTVPTAKFHIASPGALITDIGFRVRNSLDTLDVIRTDGIGGVYVGEGAGRLNTSAQSVFIGKGAGYSNTTGNNNVFIGLNSGYSNVSSPNNTFIGRTAGFENISAQGNGTFIGVNAGQKNTTGISNTFIGSNSGSNNITGSSNTALGGSSAVNFTSGNNNIVLGSAAAILIADGLTNLSSMTNSIYIGSSTKALGNSQTNQIVIGHNAIGLGSNTTVLGNSSTVTTAIYGNLLLGTTANVASSRLTIDSTTQGVLLPRMTTAEVNAIVLPVQGLTVFNTDLNTLCFYTTSWQKVTSTAM